MKFSLYVIIPAGVALAFFMMQYLTATEPGAGNNLTRDEITTELTVQPFAELFEVFAEHFPRRHKAHLGAVADVMNDGSLPQARKGQTVAALNRDFIDQTRRDFSNYLGQASEERLLEIQQAAVVLLEAVKTEPALCARVALEGPGALGRTELARIDRAVLRDVLMAYFNAIVDGRDAPVDRKGPSDADWQLFLEDWLATDPDAKEMITVFLNGKSDEAEAFCQGAISFRKQLLQDGSPAGIRIMAEFSQTVAAR